jgi:hypothetical protein
MDNGLKGAPHSRERGEPGLHRHARLGGVPSAPPAGIQLQRPSVWPDAIPLPLGAAPLTPPRTSRAPSGDHGRPQVAELRPSGSSAIPAFLIPRGHGPLRGETWTRIPFRQGPPGIAYLVALCAMTEHGIVRWGVNIEKWWTERDSTLPTPGFSVPWSLPFWRAVRARRVRARQRPASRDGHNAPRYNQREPADVPQVLGVRG